MLFRNLTGLFVVITVVVDPLVLLVVVMIIASCFVIHVERILVFTGNLVNWLFVLRARFYSLERSRQSCLADYHGSLNSGMKELDWGENTIVLSGSRPCVASGFIRLRRLVDDSCLNFIFRTIDLWCLEQWS